ncbi:MAG: CDP-alcohol phosphatidyltransferase family protein [Rhodothermales bacterium]
MYRSVLLMSAMSEGNKLSIRTLGTFWTAANMLSIFRIVLVLPISYMIVVDGPMKWTLGLILLAVGTDWFDGTIARWSHTVSEWGKVLDPIADKIAASAVVLSLVIKGSLPGWFLMLVLSRDLMIVLGSVIAAHRLNRVLMSIWMGKIAVFSLSLTVLAALLKADPPVMQVSIWITSVLFIYSFLLYVVRYVTIFRSAGGSHDEGDGATGRDVPFSVTAVEPKAESVG